MKPHIPIGVIALGCIVAALMVPDRNDGLALAVTGVTMSTLAAVMAWRPR